MGDIVVNKLVKTCELFDCKVKYLSDIFIKYEYPWEILPDIGNIIIKLINDGLDGFCEIKNNVFAGKNVKIYDNVTIDGPAIIGDNTEIRPGAFIRGNVITGSGCVIGNSTELKNCILLDKVQVPHYNYVGDSVLGNKSHMGAGAVCSNLKADGKAVVIHGESDYITNIKKIGAFLADGADIGCGCVLNPGTVVGKNTSVYPLTALRGVYPADCIVKSQTEITERI